MSGHTITHCTQKHTQGPTVALPHGIWVYTEGARRGGRGTHQGSWRQEGLTLVMALVVAPSFKQRKRELVDTPSDSPMAHPVSQEWGPPWAPSRIPPSYSGPDTCPHAHRLGCMLQDPRQRAVFLEYLTRPRSKAQGKKGTPNGTVIL